MKKEPGADFRGLFRFSIRSGTAYHLLYFGIELLSGYLLSLLLENALSANGRTVLLCAAVMTVMLLTIVPLLYALSRRFQLRQQEDRQRFLSHLYSLMLEGRLRFEDSGAMDVKLEKDAERIAAYYSVTIPQTVGSAVTFAGSTLLLLLADWKIGLLFSLLNLVQLFPPLVYERWAKKIYEQTRSDEESYFGWLLEGSQGIQTLKAYGQESWFLSHFAVFSRQIIRMGKKAEQTMTVESIIYEAVNTLLNYGTYVILGVFVLMKWVSIQHAPFFLVLSSCLFSSVQGFYDLKMASYEVQCAAQRLTPQKLYAPTVKALEPPVLLQTENVHMSYEEKQVLCGVSLSIRQGEKILLSGANGSGKSTLLRILLGMEAPNQGDVIYAERLMNRKMSIAFLLQEDMPLSFTGTELVQALSTGEKVDSALLQESLESFELTASDLDAPLSQLSAGQRQKFYLSVALSGRSELLILDEPTNHLDARSISCLSQYLCRCEQTVLMCSHDRTLKVPWDRVMEVREGIIH